jgi:integrase
MASIKKRGDVWRARYRDDAGKEHAAHFPTRARAQQWLDAETAKLVRGEWVDPKARRVLFSDVAAEWLDANPKKRSTTRARDETIVRVHLKPKLGTRPVGVVTRAEVRGLVESWSEQYAPRTVRRMFGVVRAVFAFAMDEDYIGRSPCRSVQLPEVPALERPHLSAADVAALADALGDDYAPIPYLGVMLGMRWGEVAGLRVGRIDFMRGALTIAEQLTRGEHGHAVSGAPKSEAGRRTLSVPAGLLEMLSEHLARRGLTGADSDAYVFVMRGGCALDYSRWRRRVWNPAAVAARLGELVKDEETGRGRYEGLTFHDLRRANATALVLDGVDLKTAQARLGHSDPRLTLGVYAQATSEGDRAAAERLDARFLGSRGLSADSAAPSAPA